jgi:ABC-2 type transport system ATP-binding protein
MEYTVDLYGVDQQEATPVLQAHQLRKRYGGTPALDGFDLTVAPGEIAGLIGHNGAGKTTFVSVVAALIRPDAGTVTIAGEPAGRHARRLIGVAPQTLGLYPAATVREHLRLFGELAGLARHRLTPAIAATAEALLLTEHLDQRVRELSGGQQRRVQAATALVHRPPLLLMDEPTVGADPVTREALLTTLRQAAARGTAIVYTTHYLPELDALDATLAVAQAGRVVARGGRADLLADLPGSLAATFPGGREVTIPTRDPGAALAQLLASEDTLPERVDLRRPSLDDLYKALS